MKKQVGSFVAILVAAVTVCSIAGTSPVFASSKAPHKTDSSSYAKGVTGSETYSSAIVNDSKGQVTQESSQALLRSNYLTGKLDSQSESSIIAQFKRAGLTEADFYALKAQRNSKVNSSAPALRLGWGKDGSGNWFYSTDGRTWKTNGWLQVSGTWYYFDASSHAVTGWQQIGGKWYYFDSSCAMLANTTVNGYRLSASGAME